MPRGPSPALTLKSGHAVSVAASGESLIDEVDTEIGSSCSSLLSWDSDSEVSLSEPSVIDDIDGDCTTDELEISSLYSFANGKRRRLDARALGTLPKPARFGLTLIILDWDDTLFPNTWLLEQGLNLKENSVSPNETQKMELRNVARLVSRTLRRAKCCGTVIVITNAERGWVELTSRRFLPEVVPHLEGVKIVSARSKFEHAWPANPVQWKTLAFYTEVDDFFDKPSKHRAAGPRENVISIGDSMHEREALLEATELRNSCNKSLKFMDKPSPAQLVQQHLVLSAAFRALVEYEDNVDLRF
jgi:hypothetical protein